MIDVGAHRIQSICGAWHAKLLFVRDPGCMLGIDNWFAYDMKSQDVGSANSCTWKTTAHLKVQYALKTGRSHSAVFILKYSVD